MEFVICDDDRLYASQFIEQLKVLKANTMSCSIAFIMTIMRTLWRALEIRNVIKPIYIF